MKNDASWEKKLAWQEAWQVRGCPPEAILRGAFPTLELKRHLEGCPFCSDHRDAPPLGTRLLEAMAAFDRAAAKPAGGERAPGEIWSVRRSLAGWGPGDRHYNPPLVLILERPGDPSEAVRVAQVYHDPALAGPGDVPLAEDLFAESWNVYTVSERDLETCFGRADESALEAVLEAAATGIPSLDAEASPVLEAFRRLEIEVGAFFALPSVERMLRRAEGTPSARLRSHFQDPKSLVAHFRDRHPSLSLPGGAGAPLEALALARFSDEELPLAAAGDANRILVHRVIWTAEGPDLRAVRAELTFWRHTPEGLTVGGQIEDRVDPGSELLAWWALPDRPPTAAGDVTWSWEGGFFRVQFLNLGADEVESGRLALLVCDPAESTATNPDADS